MAEGQSSGSMRSLFADVERFNTSGRRSRRAVLVTAGAGAALTAALSFTPAVAPSGRLPDIRTILETSLVLIATLVGILAWGRYRLRRDPVDLALAGVVTFAWVLQPAWDALGGALGGHDGSVWAASAARLLGALTLAAATSQPLTGRVRRRKLVSHIRALTLAGTATTAACAAIAGVIAFAVLAGGVGVPSRETPLADSFGRWPAFELLELLSVIAFFIAAWAFAGRADADGDRFVAWVGLACVLDALVGVNYALFPTLSTAWLYTGDYFRVLAMGAWAVAGYHEIARYQAETARVARLEERRRIARDLHDGLAQDLAYLSSRAKLLLSSATADRASLSDIATTSERALQESRRAVLSLTRPVSAPLDADLAKTAQEAARGYPTRVRVLVDPRSRVDPHRREALVCIVREAVYNASRHGRANTATVEVAPSKRGMVLRVTDDGNGFDPAIVRSSPAGLRRSSFGLVSMEERCRAVGGRFALSSAPGRGTTVEVELP
jgi:signal transduction histidine kinase